MRDNLPVEQIPAVRVMVTTGEYPPENLHLFFDQTLSVSESNFLNTGETSYSGKILWEFTVDPIGLTLDPNMHAGLGLIFQMACSNGLVFPVESHAWSLDTGYSSGWFWDYGAPNGLVADDERSFYDGILAMQVFTLPDFNTNGLVDGEDYAAYAPCIGGPGITAPPPGCSQAGFDAAKLDGDDDVDLADFREFQLLYASPP